MFGIQFNIGPSRQALKRATDLLGDMTPVFDDVADYLHRETKKRFVSGTDPSGKAWPAKRQSTLDRYKQLGYGNLTRPLIGPSKSLSTQILRIVTKDSATIGSNLIYSGVMQGGAAKGAFGTDAKGRPIPWGRIPARTWLGLSDADNAAIVDIAEEHIEEALGRDG